MTILDRPRTRTVLAAVLVAVAAATTGCDFGATRGEGAVTSETRETDTFSRIEAGAGVNISIAIGAASPLELRAQGNILPIILTEVSGDTLRIHSSEAYTTSEKVEVVVATPRLDRIVLSGGSRGSIDGVASDAFDIDLSGGSALTATGSASTVSLEVSGGSVAELEAMTAASINVDLSGGSRAEVRATDQVNGSASGGTRLSVFGDADVSVETTDGSQVDRR